MQKLVNLLNRLKAVKEEVESALAKTVIFAKTANFKRNWKICWLSEKQWKKRFISCWNILTLILILFYLFLQTIVNDNTEVAKVALGQDKQRKLPFKIMYAFCWSCPSATFASQHGGFVPREWKAAKGLFKMLSSNRIIATVIFKISKEMLNKWYWRSYSKATDRLISKRITCCTLFTVFISNTFEFGS